MHKLNDIFKDQEPIIIKDVKTDSREVEEKDIFVATHGFNVDHSDYIDDAIKNGAAAVVTDIDYETNIPCIKVDNVEKSLSEICKKVYDYDNDLKLIGITGTDGKTTTATILKNLLRVNTAYIGTNGIEYKNIKIKTDNTTPKKEILYKIFSNLKQNSCENIVMEVSSESLLHNRVDSFLYKYAIFTNITEDHLNIHKTIDSYIKSKLKLLDYLDKDGIIIVNNDDKVCRKINDDNHKIHTYGKSSNSDFQICDINYKEKFTTFTIKYKDKKYKIKSPYPFEYNIYNLTAAFIVCYLERLSIRKIIKKIKKLKPIMGRCEHLDFNQNYKIILDYAHTENGIRNLIENVKKYNKKIIVVTGSAGGREKEKRSKIGKYLLNNVDLVIFTMDDPRNESVDDIINQMIGEETNDNYIRIQNREKAIFYALDIAKENDYVLIIGKGRDNYMAIGNERIDYCDYDVIYKYFN